MLGCAECRIASSGFLGEYQFTRRPRFSNHEGLLALASFPNVIRAHASCCFTVIQPGQGSVFVWIACSARAATYRTLSTPLILCAAHATHPTLRPAALGGLEGTPVQRCWHTMLWTYARDTSAVSFSLGCCPALHLLPDPLFVLATLADSLTLLLAR